MKNTIDTEKIEKFLKDNKLTKTQFGKLCNINHVTLKRVFTEKEYINMVTLFNIARVMNTGIKDLIKEE